jgi:hypothetical protein
LHNQLVEGTTVYLPVNHPGALLFVGDGHAAQGCRSRRDAGQYRGEDAEDRVGDTAEGFLTNLPEGYRAMNDDEAIKVMIDFSDRGQ